MPLYDFTCTECGTKFEKRISYSGNFSDLTCPKGHHTVQRIYSAPQVVFKGGGWYINDSRGGATSSTADTSK